MTTHHRSDECRVEPIIESERGGPDDGAALILVVERDPHTKKLEQFFLEQAGFRVEFADDGINGLERARVVQPHILVTEIMLPGADGLKVCQSLKSDPATEHIPVVVFSILEAEERALEAGADAFLRKPLDDTQLIDTIQKLLAEGKERST